MVTDLVQWGMPGKEAPEARRCIVCKEFKDLRDFREGRSLCKECQNKRVYALREGNRGWGTASIRAVTSCPACSYDAERVEDLISHLRTSHTTDKGVIGLDCVVCLLCRKIRKGSIAKHLWLNHALTGEHYLKQFPRAIIEHYRSSELGGGRAQAGQRRRHYRQQLKEVHRVCHICSALPDDLDLHLRKRHLLDLDTQLYPADSLARQVLAMRHPNDVHWTWGKNEALVYVVQAGGPDRPIKFGFTQRLLYRLRTLQTSLPDQIIILKTFPGSIEDELAAHKLFKHLSVRREWFHPADEIWEYLSQV